MPKFALSLDVHKRTARLPQQVVVRVGDTESQVVECQLLDDGQEYSPASGTAARLDILKADGTWCRQTASVSGSTVSCMLSSQAVSSPGDARLAHFVLVSGSRAESTEGFELRVLRNVDATGEEAGDYDSQLQALYDKWAAYEAKAEEQEQARERLSTTAAQAATEAAAQAIAAAQAAKSAGDADNAVWLGYDDEGYLCIYETRS